MRIKGSADYDVDIARRLKHGRPGEALFFDLALDDLGRAADLFLPVHQRTRGVDGWVSLEVSPLLAYDAPSTLAAARELHARAARPNLFIKIPGTAEGLPAIEEAIFAGVPVNVTLLFSTAHYRAAAEAWLRGIERRLAAGLSPDVALGGVAVHQPLGRGGRGQAAGRAATLKLGIAVGRQAYKAYGDFLASPRCRRVDERRRRAAAPAAGQHRHQGPEGLGHALRGALAAPFTVNTLPEGTLKAFADHGRVGRADAGRRRRLRGGAGRAFAAAGIDLDALAARLQSEGAASFVASWHELLGVIASKSAVDRLKTRSLRADHEGPGHRRWRHEREDPRQRPDRKAPHAVGPDADAGGDGRGCEAAGRRAGTTTCWPSATPAWCASTGR